MAKSRSNSSKADIEIKKFKAEIWLNIANLILTAIIGIAIAIFLKYRDEQVQKDIIALQAEIEQQASLAHLEVATTCLYYTSCDGAIEIKNLGPASARNVKAVIALEVVDEAWEPLVDDISRFTVRKFPPSLDITMQTRTVDVLYDFQMVSGNNAVELSIDTLPPDSRFQVLLTFTPQGPVKEYEVSIPVTMYIDDGRAQMLSEAPLRQYLEKRFQVASFSGTTTCENCEGSPSKITFQVSVLQGWGLQTIDLQENEQGLEWQTLVRASYQMPEVVSHTPISSPIYLNVIGPDEMGNTTIQEISQPD